MTERSRFWDGSVLGDCGPYTQTHIHDQVFRSILGATSDRGVCKGWRDEMLVSGASSPVSVAAGGAVVYGMLYDSDAATTVSVPTPSAGNSRYDIVCVQRDWTTQVVRIARHAGVAAAAPAVPTLTQTAGVTWEIPLATALIDDAGTITLTDSREWCWYSTEWPANIVTAGMYAEGAVTTAKIPNRTRYEADGTNQIKLDATNPAAWAAGPTWDYFTFTNGVTDSVWTTWMAPTGLVGGQVNFYIWNGPTAVAAGNVKWDYNIYHGTDGGTLTNTAGTIAAPIAQGGRAVGNVYRDQVPDVALAVGSEQIINFQLSRDGGADTYGSPVWVIGIEIEWTADS